MVKIGIIGDTHGFFHPAAVAAFQDVNQIIHTGDIGGPRVLAELAKIAPVIAVRGNYDVEPELLDRLLPDPSGINIAGLSAFLTHRLFSMSWPESKNIIAELLGRGENPPRLVIFGHTHFPVLEEIGGIWFINPGYAGPDRLEGPLTAAVLEIEGQTVSGEIVKLE